MTPPRPSKGAAPGGPSRSVVVGVDDSEGARAALTEAVRTASRRGDRLRVITAYAPPGPTYRVGGWPAALFGPWQEAPPPDRVAVEGAVLQRAHRLLAATLREVGLARRARPEIRVEALPGGAVDVLTREADCADELVVGHRAGAGALDAVLGSVGLGCVLHAPCPVTVVPPRPEADARRSSAARPG